MQLSLDFENVIDGWWLTFKRKRIESVYSAQREKEFSAWLPRCVIILVTIFMNAVFLFRIKSDQETDNSESYVGGIASVAICDFCIVAEFVVQCFPKLKVLRGIFMAVGLMLGCTIYSATKFPVIAYVPGITGVLAASLFCNLWFSYNWFTSTLGMYIASILSTLYLGHKYYSTHTDFGNYIAPLVNFNAYLLFLPFFYYNFEKRRREIAFLTWQREKEMKFWKKLITALPVGIIISHKKDVVYFNPCTLNTLCKQAPSQRKKETLMEALKNIKTKNPPQESLADYLFPPSETCREVKEVKFLIEDDSKVESPIAVSLMKYNKAGEEFAVCLIQDQKILEELEQEKIKAQIQKNFLAMVTHDLRNPLQGLMGILEIFQTATASPELQYYCRIGTNTGKLMMSLINDILDISQIEANKLTLIEEEADFVAVVEECMEIMKLQYDKKDLYLRTHKELSIPSICNDKRRYSQILLNLLSNALKFTSNGGVLIELEYNKEERTIITSVSDTGIGIEKEKMDKLFNMYQKFHSTSQNPNGIGLGLVVCKKLAEQMGGIIKASSVVGEGTKFTFTIKDKGKLKDSPIHAEPEKQQQIIVEEEKCASYRESLASFLKPEAPSPTSLASPFLKEEPEVLIIDDDTTCSFILQKFCQSLQITSSTASSGEAGLKLVQQRILKVDKEKQYKLFFIDMNMPGINGIETSERILDTYSKNTLSCTIIGLSGDSSDALSRCSVEAGMKEILVKPFSQKDVEKIIKKYHPL